MGQLSHHRSHSCISSPQRTLGISIPAALLLCLISSHLPAAEPLLPPSEASPDALPKEETVEREANAGEDPLATQTTEDQASPVTYKYKDHTSFSPYGSARIRYRETDDSQKLDDGGSRIGVNGELQFQPSFWLLGRAEIGFNLFDTVGQFLNASDRPSEEDRSVSTRLAYAGIQTPTTTLTYGKNWSSYYQVAALTDRFESFGGEASGTFNAGTDGGASGTGRANNVLQGRFSIDHPLERSHIKPFKLNFQAQLGNDIPGVEGARYPQSLGISALLETESEKVIGIAYNHAFIDEDTSPGLKAKGIGGDARALLIGTRRFGDRYYLGTTVSILENHETTDKGIYFDAWGWEVFGSYNLSGKWWAIGGWNALEQRKDERLAGAYRLRYGIVGLRYSFDKLRQFIYTETRLDNSINQDGSIPGNVYTLGIRWDIR